MSDQTDRANQPTEPKNEPFPTISDTGAGEKFIPPRDTPKIEGHQIIGKLGEGGMGVVWRAIQISTKREVALKLLSVAAFGSEKARGRFEREVELTARLEHPNIARVYDSGIRQGVYCYAMELIEGVPLDAYVEQNHLTQQLILELMRTVCEAVQHAHQRGVIHTDLKPSNILVTSDGQPHVLDFGLAKSLQSGGAELTVSLTGQVAGTAAYMSPEQAAGKRDQLDTRTDVYSLGVILYRLLTGGFPHDSSGSWREVVRRICEEEIKRPREITKEVDRELEALLLKTLARNPNDRYATAAEIGRDISNYLQGEPLTAKAPTAAYFLGKRLRKYRLPATISSVVIGLLLGMGVFSYFRVAKERAKAISAQAVADRKAQESRERLVQQYVANGTRLMDGGDLYGSLLWFAEALKFDQGDPKREKVHRVRIGSILRQSPKLVYSFAKDDGTRIVELSQDGTKILTVAGTVAANLAVTRSDAQVWDVATGLPITPVLNQGTPVIYAHLSPDGRRIATTTTAFSNGYSDFHVQLWELGGNKSPLILLGSNQVFLAFSPDSERVATAKEVSSLRNEKLTELQTWDATSGKAVGSSITLTNTEGLGSVNGCDFSPDGQRIVCVNHRETLILDLNTASSRILSTHTNGLLCAKFSRNGGSVAVGSEDGTARVLNAKTGEALSPPLQHPSAVLDVSFSPDGRHLITGGADGTARIWDVGTGEPLSPPLPHAGPVSWARFSLDGRSVVTQSGAPPVGAAVAEVRVWSLAEEQGSRCLEPFASHAAFSPDGKRVVTANDQAYAMIWDANTGQPLSKPLVHSRSVDHLEFSPDSRILVTTSEHTTRLWDAASGKLDGSPLVHRINLRLSRAIFSTDGAHVLTVGRQDREETKDFVSIWSISNRKQVAQTAVKDFADACYVTDGPRVLTARGDPNTRVGEANVLDALTGRLITSFVQSNCEACFAQFSPNGDRVILTTANGAKILTQVWDAKTGRALTQPRDLRGEWPQREGLSTDGLRAITAITRWPGMGLGGSDQAKVWDLASGELLFPPLKHAGEVNAARFSVDGSYVVTASSDRTAKIWDASLGEPVTPPLRHSNAVFFATVSPDGNRLVTLNRTPDNSVREARLWDLTCEERPVADLVILAQLLAARRIDPSGTLARLDGATLRSIWQALRSKYPKEFSVTPSGFVNQMASGPQEKLSSLPAQLQAEPPPGGMQALRENDHAVSPTNTFISFSLAFEDQSDQQPIEVKLEGRGLVEKLRNPWPDVRSGSVKLDMAGVPMGEHYLYFSSPNYATRWVQLVLSNQVASLSETNVVLYKKRYAVAQWAVNISGGRELQGGDIEEGRCVVSHWSDLPYFGQDWQFWQKAQKGGLFGRFLYLSFHRGGSRFGFAGAADNETFESMKVAPPDEAYSCQDILARKGLLLFCRVNGDLPSGLCYGKISIEDVAETPPPGIPLIEGR